MSPQLLDAAARALLDPRCAPPASHQAATRFDVHRNTVLTSLVDALADGAPVTHAVVGDAFFRVMAAARVRTDPPRSPVLAAYVDGFGDFIATYLPATDLPWLADLARLEALRVQAYHAVDAASLPLDAFTALAADPDALQHLRLRLHPAARWLRSTHAVADVWHAHQADDVDAALASLDIDVPQDMLVTRPAFHVHVHALPPGAIALLDALAADHPLALAFGHAVASDPQTDPAALFALLARHGLVVDVLHPRSPQ